MRNSIETAFYVAFEYPLRRLEVSQCGEALFYGVSRRSLWSEAVRVRVRCGFRYGIEGQQVQGLHSPALHDWNAQSTFLAVFLGYRDSPQGLGMVIPLPERVDGVDLLV